MSEQRKKPVHEFRMGPVKALVWENETSVGVRHNVTLSRLYKDGDDQWQETTSFGRDDLPLVAKVSDRAHSWIYDQAGKSAEDRSAA